MRLQVAIAAALCAGVLVGAGCAKRVFVEPAVDASIYKRMAIVPFAAEGTVGSIASQLADEITLLVLERAPQIQIVERTKINVLTLPENLQDGARSKDEIAIALGQLLQVDAVLTGTVSISIGNVTSANDWDRRVVNAVAIVRLIDTRDGRVTWAKREETGYTDSRYLHGSTAWRTDYEITQEVIRDLAELIAQNFYPHYERR